MPDFGRGAGWCPGVTAWGQGLEPSSARGQDSRVDAGEISTRGDCVIVCGSMPLPARPQSRSWLLRPQGQTSLQSSAFLVIPGRAPNALRIPPAGHCSPEGIAYPGLTGAWWGTEKAIAGAGGGEMCWAGPSQQLSPPPSPSLIPPQRDEADNEMGKSMKNLWVRRGTGGSGRVHIEIIPGKNAGCRPLATQGNPPAPPCLPAWLCPHSPLGPHSSPRAEALHPDPASLKPPKDPGPLLCFFSPLTLKPEPIVGGRGGGQSQGWRGQEEPGRFLVASSRPPLLPQHHDIISLLVGLMGFVSLFVHKGLSNALPREE